MKPTVSPVVRGLLLVAGLTGSAAGAGAQTVFTDVLQADRVRNQDRGGDGLYWEHGEDDAETLRFLYGPLSGTPLKVDIGNPANTRFRLTKRGGAVWTGTLALGLDPAMPVGAGQRMMWHHVKRAFRAGEVTGSHWDESGVGQSSVAIGFNPVAAGFASVALGSQVSALGDGSVGLGTFLSASGRRSMVVGSGVVDSFISLSNTIDDSLVVGFNSNRPTLYVGPGAGEGTVGTVGIGTTDTQGWRLFVDGDTQITTVLRVGGRDVGASLDALTATVAQQAEEIVALRAELKELRDRLGH